MEGRKGMEIIMTNRRRDLLAEEKMNMVVEKQIERKINGNI